MIVPEGQTVYIGGRKFVEGSEVPDKMLPEQTKKAALRKGEEYAKAKKAKQERAEAAKAEAEVKESSSKKSSKKKSG